FAEAAATYHGLLQENPADADTWRLLGNLLAYSMADMAAGVAAYRHALVLRPDDNDTMARLCDNLMNSRHAEEGGFIDEAHALAQRLLARARMTPDLAD